MISAHKSRVSANIDKTTVELLDKGRKEIRKTRSAWIELAIIEKLARSTKK